MFIICKMFHISLSEKRNKMVGTEWFHLVKKLMYIYVDKRPKDLYVSVNRKNQKDLPNDWHWLQVTGIIDDS